MTSLHLYAWIGFGIGLLFGSFLNVCIARLPKHDSIVTPRSRCLACGHAIRWYDNVPLLSWLVLRARCRDCGAAIPWTYPAVELALGLWFVRIASQLWMYWHVETVNSSGVTASGSSFYSLELLGIAIFGFLLIGLMVMDWQTQLLPDAFTLTGIAIALFLVCTQAIFLGPGEGQIILDSTHQLRLSSPGSFASQGNIFMTGPEALIMGRVAAVAGSASLLLLIRWIYQAIRKQEGMGLGDVKLLAMIAAFLGFWGSLLALFLGVLTATVYGITMIGKRTPMHEARLPFGSFLAAGGLAASLVGERFIAWYASLFR